jgi:hypothetical protein
MNHNYMFFPYRERRRGWPFDARQPDKQGANSSRALALEDEGELC